MSDVPKRGRGRPPLPQSDAPPPKRGFGRPRTKKLGGQIRIVKMPSLVRAWLAKQAHADGLVKREDENYGAATYMRYLIEQTDWNATAEAVSWRRDKGVPLELTEEEFAAYKRRAYDLGYAGSFSTLIYMRVVLPAYIAAGEAIPSDGE